MNGDVYVIPPQGDMTETEYVGSAPSLNDVYTLLGSSQVQRVTGLTTWEQDGKIVPAAACCCGDGETRGLALNQAGMNLWQVALMRAGAPAGGGLYDTKTSPYYALYGNVVLGCGDEEFMAAIHALFPPPPPMPQAAGLNEIGVKKDVPEMR